MLDIFDAKKIADIILEVWNAEKEEAGGDLSDLNIWVSYIMGYGYSDYQIKEFAAIYGAEFDASDCDPDDEYDSFGALKITEALIEKITEI